LESNWEEMKMSISKIKNYPDDILIYPGHGISSDLGHEKKYNPYF
jgi:glyoxylase-like metal-dependent hydrolase (beta-lactamase superfamily II)